MASSSDDPKGPFPRYSDCWPVGLVPAVILSIGLLLAACEAAPPQPDPAIEEISPREPATEEAQPTIPVEEPPENAGEQTENALDRTLTGLRLSAGDPTEGSCESGAPSSTPELRNRNDARRALVMEYPSLLRDAGVGGTTLIDLHISPFGIVEEVLVAETSGYEQLDQAALRAAQAFEFCPALLGGQPVAVWTQTPITFSASDTL